jgi:hypothetical protein
MRDESAPRMSHPEFISPIYIGTGRISVRINAGGKIRYDFVLNKYMQYICL